MKEFGNLICVLSFVGLGITYVYLMVRETLKERRGGK